MSILFYDEQWVERAACRSMAYKYGHEVFFHERGESASRTRQAREICWACPVQVNCLEYALRESLNYGIFGGYTDTERRAKLPRKISKIKKRDPSVSTKQALAHIIEGERDEREMGTARENSALSRV